VLKDEQRKCWGDGVRAEADHCVLKAAIWYLVGPNGCASDLSGTAGRFGQHDVSATERIYLALDRIEVHLQNLRQVQPGRGDICGPQVRRRKCRAHGVWRPLAA
jgi:hypothetical protein